MRLCVVRNKSTGRAVRGKKAVQGLEIHQVPGTLVVGGFGVSWLQAGLLLWKGSLPPPFCSLSSSQRKSFGRRVSDAHTEGINDLILSFQLFTSPSLTRAESSAATVSQPGCRQPKKIIKLYRGQIEPESGMNELADRRAKNWQRAYRYWPLSFGNTALCWHASMCV